MESLSERGRAIGDDENKYNISRDKLNNGKKKESGLNPMCCNVSDDGVPQGGIRLPLLFHV